MRWQFLLLIGLRTVVFLITCGALGCHIGNIILLSNYSKSIPLPAWSTHLPYILYLVALGLSFICSLALLGATIARVKSLLYDKCLSIFNTIIVAAALIYNTIRSGPGNDPEPWLNGNLQFTKKPNPGFMPYCSAFNDPSVALGSNLFLRCWLINGLWIGTIVACVSWVALGIFVWTQHTSDVYDEDEDYHYKSDIPLVPAQSPGRTYNHTQNYNREEPFDRSMTTSPAAKAAATYAYGKPTYDGYSQPSTPGYQDYNPSKTSTPGHAYSSRYGGSEGDDGYYDNYVPYRHHDNISPGAQTQSSKYQDDDREDYYSTPVPEPVTTGRYPSPHTQARYGNNSPSYRNTNGGYQNPGYDYRTNSPYTKNNSYEGR